MPKAIVTGSAGFIGMHVSERLLSEGWEVLGVDALTMASDRWLPEARLARLEANAGYRHEAFRIETPGAMTELMQSFAPDRVIHLAAEAGVRASITDPRPYLMSNTVGTFEVLEGARHAPPGHLLMASTSSAYGAITDMPFVETMRADWPVSFYAASKRSTEILAHSHSHIYGLPITMFRFFTVYGPWGRPDMAYYLFTDAILNGRPIKVFNHGQMRRDFVYIDDLVEAIIRLGDCVPPDPDAARQAVAQDSLSPAAAFRLVNIGKSAPDSLEAFISEIERATGRTAERQMLPMQQGDVPATWADASLLQNLTGFLPETPLSDGIPKFVAWYRDHVQTAAGRS